LDALTAANSAKTTSSAALEELAVSAWSFSSDDSDSFSTTSFGFLSFDFLANISSISLAFFFLPKMSSISVDDFG
jgi:hypothetical protein